MRKIGWAFANGMLTMVLVMTLSVMAYAATLQWDPNPVTDNLLYYTVKLDGVVLAQVQPILDTTCNCVDYPLPVLANGAHTVSVSATNQWGTSGDTTLSFNVGGPGTVKNVRIR